MTARTITLVVALFVLASSIFARAPQARAQDYYGTAPTVIREQGVPALWVTGLSIFAAAYIVPPIVALGIEGRSRALEIPVAGWIVFLANRDCPDTPAGGDASDEQECTLATVGVAWSGAIQLAGLGLFIAGVAAHRTIRVVGGPPVVMAPIVLPGGGGLALSWRG